MRHPQWTKMACPLWTYPATQTLLAATTDTLVLCDSARLLRGSTTRNSVGT